VGDQSLHGHPIPIYTRRERVSTARTLLVGDAAGMADPLSGEGIRFAIKTGRLAAETLLKGHSQRYPRELARTVGVDHFFATLISLLFYFCQDLLLFLGSPNPFSTQAIVDMLGDRMSTAGFFFYSGLTLPLFVATEVISRTFRRLGYVHLSDRIRSWVYPQDVNNSYHTGGFAGQF
jgi:flavin-dependent dehydrogenase